ncbi:MAG TPA: HAD family phosphatase [Polyangiaceae bacterium]|nr:HAD family phosphatase [Polyangiaceae bacterium]
MLPPQVVLWDVMDTLVRDPFRDVMPQFFGMTLQQMMQGKNPTAWGRFERGELSDEQFLSQFFADGRSFDHDGFRGAIRSSYAWLAGMEELLAELAEQGVAMHALSNYPVWYRWIEERLRLSRFMSWRFVSCELGLRKPDPAIFEHAIAALGVEAARCVFIDDRAGNCEAAAACGMRAIHFRGDARSVASELAELGLTARR